jgi:16S rRNA pseudouridine516 synthase
MKLDRLVASQDSAGRTAAHRWIAAGRVRVDGVVVRDGAREVDRFMRVELDGVCIQPAARALYMMLHKPVGCLSATSDPQHPTVLDLIDDPDKMTLHLAGRLDRASSGLLLLTNDGRWSKRLMDPDHKVPKSYLVETTEPLDEQAVAAFAEGFYFHTEDIHTRPAKLEILASHRARVTLHEGRYHQIKRMFHRVENRVVSLHRESIGALKLPHDLAVGKWCLLNDEQRQQAITTPV